MDKAFAWFSRISTRIRMEPVKVSADFYRWSRFICPTWHVFSDLSPNFSLLRTSNPYEGNLHEKLPTNNRSLVQ
eukprot:g79883.t1